MSATGKKLFQTENRTLEPEQYYLLFSTGEVRHLHPEKDRLLLGNIARNAVGTQQKAALRRLGLTEPPPPNPDYVSDGLFDESYWILDEQIRQMEEMADWELLHAAAFASRSEAACFAFCRLTGSRLPSPACDAYSHRDYACGRAAWMKEEDVRAFCREMIEQRGPFARECEALLRAGKAEGG